MYLKATKPPAARTTTTAAAIIGILLLDFWPARASLPWESSTIVSPPSSEPVALAGPGLLPCTELTAAAAAFLASAVAPECVSRAAGVCAAAAGLASIGVGLPVTGSPGFFAAGVAGAPGLAAAAGG